MTRSLPLLVAVPVLVVLAGCGQAENAANEAASQVGAVAAAEVRRQVCAPVLDGKIGAQDRQVLAGLVATAKGAGVSNEITAPLDQIAAGGDQVPAESVTALLDACR